MLMQRILTAIVLIPIFLALLFFLTPFGFAILTAIITLLAAWEWSKLIGIYQHGLRLLYLLLIVLLIGFAIFVHVVIIFALACLFWLAALIMIILYPRLSNWWSKHIFWRCIMGCFVLIPCWTAINFIRANFKIETLLFLFILIWGADSAAYGIGKMWGKNKLAPLVSPGKSIQGLVAALVFAVIAALIMQWLFQVPINIWVWGTMLSIITVLFSIIGDLFESMLKRQAGLKDSSQLIPGHGGILDRIDSLTAAAPIFALGTILMGLYLG